MESRRRNREIGKASGHFSFCGTLQQLMNQRLVGLRLPRGQAAELRQQARGDANGDELLGMAGLRSAQTGPGRGTAHADCAAEFLVGGLRDVREVNLSVGNTLCAPCGLRGAR